MSVDLNRRTELYRAANSFEAQLLKLELQAGGVHVFVENEELSMGVGDLPMGWTTAPRLMVPDGEYELARRLLDQMLSHLKATAAETSPDDHCPKCGGPYQNDQCDACRDSADAQIHPVAPKDTIEEISDNSLPNRGMYMPLDPSSVRDAWTEVAIMLCLGVIPFLAEAIHFRFITISAPPYVVDMGTWSICSLCTWAVVAYLMRRSDLTMEQWGVPRWHFLDIVLGIILAFVALIASDIVNVAIPDDWRNPAMKDLMEAQTPRFFSHFVVLTLAMIANSLVEEFVTRAYLITRLSQLLKQRRLAVLASTGLFASYHIYQGFAGVAFAFIFGLLMSVSFVVLGRIWPAVIAHTLYNLAIFCEPILWPTQN